MGQGPPFSREEVTLSFPFFFIFKLIPWISNIGHIRGWGFHCECGVALRAYVGLMYVQALPAKSPLWAAKMG